MEKRIRKIYENHDAFHFGTPPFLGGDFTSEIFSLNCVLKCCQISINKIESFTNEMNEFSAHIVRPRLQI